jgi:GntR family negative regulator for fad regulon and positive regulator of fabA
VVRPLTSSNDARAAGPFRPATHAESTLISGILDGTYPPGSSLPAERALATIVGVTRPTLREALKKLERDGWISIQHGKTTRVSEIFEEGGLNILSSLVQHREALPQDFVEKLLEVRLAMAPAYAGAAVAESPALLRVFLDRARALADTPEAFAAFDWQLHLTLTRLSGNFVFRLILNGFQGFYEEIARLYFSAPEARRVSRDYYQGLAATCSEGSPSAAVRLTRDVMTKSLAFWRTTKLSMTEVEK